MTSREILNNLRRVRKEENKPASTQPIVYRKGQKPLWVDEEESEEDDIFLEENANDEELEEQNENKQKNQNKVNKIEHEDKRYNRYRETKSSENPNQDINERIKLRREIYKSEIVSTNNKDENKTQSEGRNVEIIDISRRREILKNSLNEANKENEQEDENELLDLIGDNSGEEDKNEEDNSNYENNSDEFENEDEDANDDNEEVLMRPIFVSKEDRKTISEELHKEMEEKELLQQQERLKELKKRQTKEIVKKYIEEEESKENIQTSA